MASPDGIKSFLKKAAEVKGIQYSEDDANNLLKAYKYDYGKLVTDLGRNEGFTDESIDVFKKGAYETFGIKDLDDMYRQELILLDNPSDPTDEQDGYKRYNYLKKQAEHANYLKSELEKRKPAAMKVRDFGRTHMVEGMPVEVAIPEQDTDLELAEYSQRYSALDQKYKEVSNLLDRQAKLNKKKTGYVSEESMYWRKEGERIDKMLTEKINQIYGAQYGVVDAPQIPLEDLYRQARSLQHAKTQIKKIYKALEAPIGSSARSQIDGFIQGLFNSTPIEDFASLGINEIGRNIDLLRVTKEYDKQYKFIQAQAENAEERNDGTKKGMGWLGEIKLPNGEVATEYTIGVQMNDGTEYEIPTLIPTLTEDEIKLMVNDIIPNKKQVPLEIRDKAIDFAIERMNAGQSPFISTKELAFSKLKAEDAAMLHTYMMLQEIQSKSSPNFWYSTGEGLQYMIPFIAEFAATAGAGKAAKTIVTKSVDDITKRMISKYAAKESTTLFAKTAGTAAKVAFQPLLMPSTYKLTTEKQLATFGEEGEVVEGMDLPEAFMNSWVEMMAEVVGEEIPDMMKVSFRNAIIKRLAKDPGKAQEVFLKTMAFVSSDAGIPSLQGMPFELIGEEITGALQAVQYGDYSFFTSDAQLQLLAVVAVAGGSTSLLTVPQRIMAKSSFEDAQKKLDDNADKRFTDAVKNLPANYSDVNEGLKAYRELQKQFPGMTKDQYVAGLDYVYKAYRFNQMSVARSMQIEKGLEQFGDDSGNLSTAQYNDEILYIRNPEDAYDPQRPETFKNILYTRTADGTIKPIQAGLVGPIMTQTKEQVEQSTIQEMEVKEKAYQEAERIKAEAAKKKIEPGRQVTTIDGKKTVDKINPDGTITALDNNGQPSQYKLEDIEPVLTKAEQEQAQAEQEALMKGIEPEGKVTQDNSETITGDRQLRVVDFSNGQSKIIVDGKELIANSEQEKDDILYQIYSEEAKSLSLEVKNKIKELNEMRDQEISKLPNNKPIERSLREKEINKKYDDLIAQVESANEPKGKKLEDLSPEERFAEVAKSDMDVAIEILNDDISKIKQKAAKLRKNKGVALDQRIKNLSEAKELEAEAERLKGVASEAKKAAAEKAKTAKTRKEKALNLTQQALKLEVGRNPLHIVMQYFIAGGKINRDALTQLLGGGNKSINSEINARISLLSTEEKDIDGIAHDLWETHADTYGIDTMVFRDAVEEAILSYISPSGMSTALLEIYGQPNDITDQDLLEIQIGEVQDAYVMPLTAEEEAMAEQIDQQTAESLEGVNEISIEQANEISSTLAQNIEENGTNETTGPRNETDQAGASDTADQGQDWEERTGPVPFKQQSTTVEGTEQPSPESTSAREKISETFDKDGKEVTYAHISEKASQDLRERQNALHALEDIAPELAIHTTIINSSEMPLNVKLEEYNRFLSDDLKAKFRTLYSSMSKEEINSTIEAFFPELSGRKLSDAEKGMVAKQFMVNLTKTGQIENVNSMLNTGGISVDVWNQIAFAVGPPAMILGEQCYIISDRITSVSEMKKNIIHEVAGHLGFRRLFPKKGAEINGKKYPNLNSFIADFMGMSENDQMAIAQSLIGDDYQQYFENGEPTEGIMVALEKVFTESAQVGGKMYNSFNELMLDFFNSIPKKDLFRLVKAYYPNQYQDYFTESGKLREGVELPNSMKTYLADEYIAEKAEAEETLTFIQRLTQLIKKAFAFTSKQFSNADVIDILNTHRQLLRDGFIKPETGAPFVDNEPVDEDVRFKQSDTDKYYVDENYEPTKGGFYLRFTDDPNIDIEHKYSRWYMDDQELEAAKENGLKEGKDYFKDEDSGDYYKLHTGLSGHYIDAETLGEAIQKVESKKHWFRNSEEDNWSIFESDDDINVKQDTPEGNTFFPYKVLFQRNNEADIRFKAEKINEELEKLKKNPKVFWHGSPSGVLKGSAYGLHIGTYQAAKEALEARIGVPAEGEWDGTREYGKTKLAGKKTLSKSENRNKATGYNTGKDIPEEDYYPSERNYKAKYSDGTELSETVMPNIQPVRIVGDMTNSPYTPHDDFKANGYMKAAITRGNAKRGYYYKNEGEDVGSISAVVPNSSHIEIIHKENSGNIRFKAELPETITIDGVERPTLNSNGKPIHPTEEGIRNFWNWFGDSKVVDEQGRPLVVYHGTASDFDSFDKNKIGSVFGDLSIGYYFTNGAIPDINKGISYGNTASEYAQNAQKSGYSEPDGANIIPAYISMSNPLVINSEGWYSPVTFMDRNRYDVANRVKESKHDGVVIYDRNKEEGYDDRLYVAFSPNQIKSATGNDGSFSSETNDIRFKVAESSEELNNFVSKSKVKETVYHGTPNATFDNFREGSIFTKNRKYAERYINQGASSMGYKKTQDKPAIYSAKIDIRNPFDTRNPKAKAIFEKEYQASYSPQLSDRKLVDWMEAEDLAEWLKENYPEYDSIILDEGGEPTTPNNPYNDQYQSIEDNVGWRGESYYIFKPEQALIEKIDKVEIDDIRFKILGQKGAEALDRYDQATRRIDNLKMAKDMFTGKIFMDASDDAWNRIPEHLQNDARRINRQEDNDGESMKRIQSDPQAKAAWADYIRAIEHREEWKSLRQELKDGRIKMLTGWEKGVDGLWRYETMDANIDFDLLNELWDNRHLANQNITFDLVTYRKDEDGTFTLSLRKKGATSTNEIAKYKNIHENQLVDLLGDSNVAYQIIDGEGFESFIGDTDSLNDAKEIKAEFTTFVTAGEPLSNILEDTELYIAYPELANVLVVVDKDYGHNASFSYNEKGEMVITLGYVNRFTTPGALVHEVQHAIQRMEGFASGGNPKDMALSKKLALANVSSVDELPGRIKELKDQFNKLYSEWERKAFGKRYKGQKAETERLLHNWRVIEDLIKKLESDTYDYDEAYDLYWKLAGEVEARNVSYRLKMKEEERMNTPLYITEEGISREDQIIIMRGLREARLDDSQGIGTIYSQLDLKESGQNIYQNISSVLNDIFATNNIPISLSDVRFKADTQAQQRDRRTDKEAYKKAFKKGGEAIYEFLYERQNAAITQHGEHFLQFLIRVIGDKNNALGIIQDNHTWLMLHYRSMYPELFDDGNSVKQHIPDVNDVLAKAGYTLMEHTMENGSAFSVKGMYRDSFVPDAVTDINRAVSGNYNGRSVICYYNDPTSRLKHQYVFTVEGRNAKTMPTAFELKNDPSLMNQEWEEYLTKLGLKFEDGTYNLGDLKPSFNDPFSLSFLMIRIGKDKAHGVEIISRYNHAAFDASGTDFSIPGNPNNTLGNKLNSLADKFQESLFNYKGIEVSKTQTPLSENVRMANDGKLYQTKREINGVYFGEDFYIDHSNTATVINPDKQILFNHFLIDTNNTIKGISGDIDIESFNIHKTQITKDGFKFYFNGRKETFTKEVKMPNGEVKTVQYEKWVDDNYLELSKKNGLNHIESDIEFDEKKNIISFSHIYTLIQSSRTSMESLNLPNVSVIPSHFLYDNLGLKEIDLPNAIEIKENFLQHSLLLIKANLPKVKTIGDNFLASNLELKSIELPEVEVIGNSFIRNTSPLESIYLPKVKSIGDSFLAGNLILTSIDLPNIERINNNFLHLNDNIKSINFPKLEYIGDDFLGNCENLQSANLPNLKTIGNGFIDRNKKLESISLPSLTKIGNEFLYSNYILESINIPLVEEIGYRFLPLNDNLKAIDLPNVIKIGADFLALNRMIKDINFPKALEIGRGFMQRATGLESINLPKVTQILYDFACGDNKLKSVNLPMVEEIQDNFLFGNNTLKSISLPNVKYIDKHFMGYNEVLEKINLPNVEQIDDGFLLMNEELRKIKLPKVHRIGTHFLRENRYVDKSKFNDAIERKDPIHFKAPSKLFYSPTERAIQGLKQEKGTVSQMKTMLLNSGAKEAELDWMGFSEAFPNVNGKITKNDLEKWFAENKIEVAEVVKGASNNFDPDFVDDFYNSTREELARRDVLNEIDEDPSNPLELFYNNPTNDTYRDLVEFANEYNISIDNIESRVDSDSNGTKFSEYQLPGGENYKEILLVIPSAIKELPSNYKSEKTAWDTYQIKDEKGNVISENGGLAQATVDALAIINKRVGSMSFISGHFSEPNIVAHIRMNERTILSKKADEFNRDYEKWVNDGKKGNKPIMAQYDRDTKVLFIEEIQSDWAQKGKKEGFKSDSNEDEYNSVFSELVRIRDEKEAYRKEIDPYNEYSIPSLKDEYPRMKELDEKENQLIDREYELRKKKNGVPDMPFKKTDQWVNLAARRSLRYAVENGFDRIAWTNGEQQADRYDLSKQFNNVSVIPNGDGTYIVAGHDNEGLNIYQENNVPESKLEETIGKDIANKVINDGQTRFEGVDLKVGGEGMKAFYDQIVPKAFSKIGKKFGAYLEDAIIPTSQDTYEVEDIDTDMFGDAIPAEGATPAEVIKGAVTVKSIPVTDQMIQSIMDEGVPMFKVLPQSNLVALHNIKAYGLINAHKLGGLPLPSIAITKPSHGFKDFGEITLMADKSMIDPKNKSSKVFGSDVYSATYPEISYQISGPSMKYIDKKTQSIPESLRESAYGNISDDIQRGGLKELMYNNYMKFLFLSENHPDFKYKPAVQKTSKEIRETFKKNGWNKLDYLSIKDNTEIKKAITDAYVKENNLSEDEVKRYFYENGELKTNLLRNFIGTVRAEIQEEGTIDKRESDKAAQEYIEKNNLQSKLNSYIRDLYSKLDINERIFKGYTPSGRKYIPHTLENVIKEMRAAGIRSGEKGFFATGAGKVRSEVIPQYKSMADIQKNADRISEDASEYMKEATDRLSDVLEMIRPYYKYDKDGFGYYPTASEELVVIHKNGKSESFKEIDDESRKEISDYIDFLTTIPTKYFEAKINRGVSLDEFKYALIPSNSDQEVKDILNAHGIEFTEYTDAEDRKVKLNEIAEQKDDIRFKVSGARKQVDSNPTEAQKEAGNYAKGHIRINGFDISIENPKGAVRSGTDRDGNEWSQAMAADYGYIRGTVGKDKDHIDVFLGDNLESGKIYVIDQIDPGTGKFDEHKVMMGFDNMNQARKAYLGSYEEGWQGLRDITSVTTDELKNWFEKGDNKKPFTDTGIRFKIESSDPKTRKLMEDFYALRNAAETARQQKRKLIESAKESDISANPDLIESQRYNQMSNLGTIEAVRSYIDTYGIEKTMTEYFSGTFAKEHTFENAIGIELYRHMNNQGKIEDAFKLLDKLANDATRSGQQVQILSLLKRMTPEGQLKYIRNEIKKVNEDIEKHNKNNIFNKKPKVEIPQEQWDGIAKQLNDVYQLMDIDDLKAFILKNSGITGVNRKRAEKLLYGMDLELEWLRSRAVATILNNVYKQIPESIGMKISTFQAISHLLNPKTFLRNIISNITMRNADMAARRLAAGIDNLLYKTMTGEKQIGKAISSEQKAEVKKAAQQKRGETMIDVLIEVNKQMSQMDKYRDIASQWSIPSLDKVKGKTNTFQSMFFGALEKGLTESLVVPDETSKEKVRKEYLAAYEALTGEKPDEQIKMEAEELALYMTFQNDSWLSTHLTKLKQLLNGVGINNFGMGDLLIKYTRVPGNIITRTFEYSPLGATKALVGIGKLIVSKEVTRKQQIDAIMALSRGLTGTALMTMGYLLAKAGAGVGDDDENDDVKKLTNEAGLSGERLNVSGLIRFATGEDPKLQGGDILLNYDWLQPVGSLIKAGSQIARSNNLGRTSIDIAVGFSELPSFMIINKMISEGMYSEADNIGEKAFDVLTVPLVEGAGGFVPAPIRQIASLTDKTARDTYYSGEDKLTQAGVKVAANIPGVRTILPARVRPTGEDKIYSTDNALLDIIATFGPASLIKYEPFVDNKILDQIAKFKSDKGTSFIPLRYAPKTIIFEGERYKLTKEEQSYYMREYGRELLFEYIPEANYIDINDIDQDTADEYAKSLSEYNKNAKEIAKQAVVDNFSRFNQ